LDPTRTLPLFTLILLAVGLLRLIEMGVSRRRQAALLGRGAALVRERRFPAMVALHVSVLAGAGLEAWMTRRAPVLAVAAAALIALAAANLLRWWVIVTLGPLWNVRIIDSARLGVVSHGPFRWVRHPNYVAVFIELVALPLLHAAWLTAALGTAAHLWVLYHRIRAEESVLLASPVYRKVMGPKPRFLPRPARQEVEARR
jgi:methyltransferase